MNDKDTIQDRVNEICNELYVKGTKPSVRLVLSMLPNVSSTSTVHKYFSTWKKEQSANQTSLYDRLGFSSDFTQSFMKEITRFSVEAEQRYKEIASDATEQKDMAIEDLARSEEKLFKQNAVLDQNTKIIKELEAELLKVQANTKAELATAKSTHETLSTELRQQLLTETDKNTELSKSNELLRTEIAKAELKLEGNAEFVAEVKEQNSILQNENKALNIDKADLSKSIAGLEATVSGHQQLITNYETAQQKNQTRLNELAEERIVLNDELKDLRLDLNNLNTSLANTKEQLNSSTTANAKLKTVHDEQVRNLNLSITNNEKLILQLEMHQDTLETEKVALIKQVSELTKEADKKE
ncbi:DNA-binding protein [Psychromonas aquimarina]|uniref:DNA-binding protein n=1 Tax=Psychromonas aquimarina TaxID=444919 RepID=UPI00068884D1|nr:DNA-binding protein [Psychromonas aquimarina]